MSKHLPWTLLALSVALAAWLALTLVHVENQRHALLTRACADPVFKGETDLKCLAKVESRPSAWQHLRYALSHVRE